MRESERLGLLKQSSSAAAPEEEQSRKPLKRRRKKQRSVQRSWYERRLSQAGIEMPPRIYCAMALLMGAGGAAVAVNLGWFLALFVGIALTHFVMFGYLDDRATKRKNKIVPQLAPFIDGLASALSTGFNLEGALAQAAQGVPPGLLRDELERMVKALNTGFTVKESVTILKERISGREIIALVVALNLFASLGGTVLEPFRRLARKIREQQTVVERAGRDLVMVKQAFYLIFLLALGAPGVLMLVQPTYLSDALSDALGRFILQIGMALILTALLGFRKITNLRL